MVKENVVPHLKGRTVAICKIQTYKRYVYARNLAYY